MTAATQVLTRYEGVPTLATVFTRKVRESRWSPPAATYRVKASRGADAPILEAQAARVRAKRIAAVLTMLVVTVAMVGGIRVGMFIGALQ